MSIRKRLGSEDSRRVALEAARALLLESGPQAVTLKAVAGRIGRTHANLLHHFGSAAELQKALAAYLAQAVCASIADAVRATRAGLGSPREVVDLTFDAFDREGGAALASWMLHSGHEDALNPILTTIHDLVEELHEPGSPAPLARLTLNLSLLALGDALVGERLASSLNLPRSAARETAEAMLRASLEERGIDTPSTG
jgi:AcrR family transcriptional regulator